MGPSPHTVPLEVAERAALTAARQLGRGGRPELLRSGTNVVFRVGDAVVRVSPAGVDVAGQVALAHWLSERGLPVLCPTAGPLAVDGVTATVWELICLGPRAWDHAPLLTWAERWGGTPGDYDAFAIGYGADLRDAPLARLLARVRLLAPTVNMIVKGAGSPRHAAEARLRMRYWRGEPSPPAWTPQ